MKRNLLLVVSTTIVLYSCEKTEDARINSAAITNNATAFTDTVKIPITDLQTGTYFGFTGGLYPNGYNNPRGKYARDLNEFAGRIKPRDAAGKVSATGKIGFISLGISTGGRNMTALKEKTVGDSATNPFLILANCNNGSGTGTFNSIINPNDPYWQHVTIILNGVHLTYKQVQVIYLESEDSVQITGFPQRPYFVRDEIEAAVRTCMAKFVHLKLVYVLGRTTTFNVTLFQNKEPVPYYNGWAEKFMIEDQINGKPGTEYRGVNAVAPLVTWGWYQWADGSNVPRKDGFVWQESDTEDGVHATTEGQDTLASRFKNFLLTDPNASIWYANHTQP